MNRYAISVAVGLGLLFGGASIQAAGRKHPMSTKTSRNEGNKSNPYFVLASSYTWTKLLPAEKRRRAAVILTLKTAGGFVCFSTSTTQERCTESMPGLKLEAGKSLSEYSEEIVYVQGQALVVGTSVYAKDYYDNADASGKD